MSKKTSYGLFLIIYCTRFENSFQPNCHILQVLMS